MPSEVLLSATSAELASAWEAYCGDLPHVRVLSGSILEIECDAVVSPANSFGFMDGNLDLLYSKHFGGQVQEQLQALIRDKHQGELLVGQAEIVETGNSRIPFVISAPTMRVPLLLGPETVNPYLAARAALLLVKTGVFGAGRYRDQPIHERVGRIAIPGLGTGAGGVHPRVCAQQVRAAIEDVLIAPRPFPDSGSTAAQAHSTLVRPIPRQQS